MADIIDEHGNPIQLTDEHGRQVQLTDEHGVPVYLTGVATTIESGHHVGTEAGFEQKMHGLAHVPPPNPVEPVVNPVEPVMNPVEPVVGGDGVGTGVPSSGPLPCHPGTGGTLGEKVKKLGRSGSSSSSSSEDDGEGGRRKKKGLLQKIKEKLPGHKNKEPQVPEKVYTATTKVSVTTPAGPLGEPKPEYVHVEHHEEEHEKKGLMDKIKDKLPGHHSH